MTEPQREWLELPGYSPFGEDTHTYRLQASLTRLREVCEPAFSLCSKAVSKARVAAQGNPKKQKRPLQNLQRLIKNQSPEVLPSGLSGAATRIRTGDLILTKDVLYQLSHSSIPQGYFLVTQIIITNIFRFVNIFFLKFVGILTLFCKKPFIIYKILKYLFIVNHLLMIYSKISATIYKSQTNMEH